MKSKSLFAFLCATIFSSQLIIAQPDTIVIGFGNYDGVSITASDDTVDPENTLDQIGYLPNRNAASRFLTQSTLGFNLADIDNVTSIGVEDWIDNQLNTVRPYTLLSSIRDYHQFVRDSSNVDANGNARMWDYAWWQYHMTTEDQLRQRVALALSEIWVISDKSGFSNNPYALGDYYDILLNNAFGNYRDIMQEVTYHASMGIYLTFLNNPKTDLEENQFPDENYARELMQLFTIGLYQLNTDGSRQLDVDGEFIPTYDNDDIAEFSKIFTGLTWGDRDQWNRGARKDTSYIPDMAMWNEYHEPGIKYLLNGHITQDNDPIDGDADITEALDNLFEHESLGPFVCKSLIQRMVTSNPSPSYIERVTTAFNNNGGGVRGDMKAVANAILLDPEALSCQSAELSHFGKLKEPFIRYYQINKAFNVNTASGTYRNDMDYIYRYISQKPLTSPSVFNFFQADYQPLGEVEEADLFAPEFQITDSQTIAGWLNALYRFVVGGNIADEYDLYSGEPNDNYADEISTLDFTDELIYTNDDELHILLDKLNLVLAQGRLTQPTLDKITETIQVFPNNSDSEKLTRVELAIYLTMTSPEYLIHK